MKTVDSQNSGGQASAPEPDRRLSSRTKKKPEDYSKKYGPKRRLKPSSMAPSLASGGKKVDENLPKKKAPPKNSQVLYASASDHDKMPEKKAPPKNDDLQVMVVFTNSDKEEKTIRFVFQRSESTDYVREKIIQEFGLQHIINRHHPCKLVHRGCLIYDGYVLGKYLDTPNANGVFKISSWVQNLEIEISDSNSEKDHIEEIDEVNAVCLSECGYPGMHVWTFV